MTIWIQPAAFIQQVQHMHANVKFVSLLGFPLARLCYHLVLPWCPVVVFGFALHSFGFALFSFICVMVLFSSRLALHWYRLPLAMFLLCIVVLGCFFVFALLSFGVASYWVSLVSMWFRFVSLRFSLCSIVLFVVLLCCPLVLLWFSRVSFVSALFYPRFCLASCCFSLMLFVVLWF